MQFNYHLPVHILFGAGQVDCLGEQASQFGKRALLVIGKSSERTGLRSRILENLRESRVSTVVFDRVNPNPLTTTAEEGAALIKAEHCDVVIGVGGGSVLDAAKGIAFLAGNEGDINEYIFGKTPTGEALPLILCPTTCGTGSEANGFAVFTNPQTKDKKSLRSPQIIPKVSIIDPQLMTTLPQKGLASVGMDAFCHNMEAYLSHNAQPFTDIMALEGMRLAAKHLPVLLEQGGEMSDWSGLAWASTLGGMVIHTVGVIAGHGMEHTVSGLVDAVHGQGLAALTPSILKATVSPATSGRMEVVSRLLGGETAADCPDAFSRFARRVGLECTLSDLGICKKDLDWLCENCMKVSSASLSAHPVAFTLQQIRSLYASAL